MMRRLSLDLGILPAGLLVKFHQAVALTEVARTLRMFTCRTLFRESSTGGRINCRYANHPLFTRDPGSGSWDVMRCRDGPMDENAGPSSST